MRICVVGMGSIGRRHVRELSALDPKVLIYSVRSGAGPACVEDNLVKKNFNSVSEAIKCGIDAAIVCTPSTLHVAQTSQFLRNNIPVLVEKPVSDSLSDLDEIIELNNGCYPFVLVGYVLRYLRGIDLVKALLQQMESIHYVQIDSGSYLPSWRPGKDYTKSVSTSRALGGGVIAEMSHELNYAQYLFDDVSIDYARLTTSGLLIGDVEDSADIVCSNSTGIKINIHLDFISKIPRRSLLVVGNDMSIQWNILEEEIKIQRTDSSQVIDLVNDFSEIYSKQLAHFIRCVKREAQPKVTLSDGIKTLELIEAIKNT